MLYLFLCFVLMGLRQPIGAGNVATVDQTNVGDKEVPQKSITEEMLDIIDDTLRMIDDSLRKAEVTLSEKETETLTSFKTEVRESRLSKFTDPMSVGKIARRVTDFYTYTVVVKMGQSSKDVNEKKYQLLMQMNKLQYLGLYILSRQKTLSKSPQETSLWIDKPPDGEIAPAPPPARQNDVTKERYSDVGLLRQQDTIHTRNISDINHNLEKVWYAITIVGTISVIDLFLLGVFISLLRARKKPN